VIFNHNKENMNTQEIIPSVPGTPFGGGFYAGRILVAGVLHALVVAQKNEGERESTWLDSEQHVAGADSYCDGMQNTVAMAEAGSELAQWARGLQIGGFTDWFIPSQDELEVMYRGLKPTTRANYLYARSGMNVSTVPPSFPYAKADPAQTTAPDFAEGGVQAFADEAYWSSTQHAAGADYAWYQDFDYGCQGNSNKSASLRARAVRRFAI
jgi:Protein of unknown function (DUF1566)